MTDEQQAIVEMVRNFVDNEIIPVAEEYDHEDKFPEPIVEQMKELGLFGVTIPEEYGGMGLDLTHLRDDRRGALARLDLDLRRRQHPLHRLLPADEVRHRRAEGVLPAEDGDRRDPRRLLALRARGRLRRAGHQVDREARTTTATGSSNGQKMWVTNGLGSSVVFVLMKNDPKADPPYKGMTCFITEKEPWKEKNEGEFAGLEIPPKIKKMGYKGVESTELVYNGYKCPPERILGGEEDGLGKGFSQMMDALEVGRVNVAARGVGIAQRALELALRYCQERKTFGKPIAQHQAIQFKLADMATKVEAARLLTRKAARMKDAGERSDLEAGMAKLLASETGKEVVEESFRIHGGYGYSKEYEIERLYRDAPLLLIGEGTSEIQRMVIGKKLLERNKI